MLQFNPDLASIAQQTSRAVTMWMPQCPQQEYVLRPHGVNNQFTNIMHLPGIIAQMQKDSQNQLKESLALQLCANSALLQELSRAARHVTPIPATSQASQSAISAQQISRCRVPQLSSRKWTPYATCTELSTAGPCTALQQDEPASPFCPSAPHSVHPSRRAGNSAPRRRPGAPETPSLAAEASYAARLMAPPPPPVAAATAASTALAAPRGESAGGGWAGSAPASTAARRSEAAACALCAKTGQRGRLRMPPSPATFAPPPHPSDLSPQLHGHIGGNATAS